MVRLSMNLRRPSGGSLLLVGIVCTAVPAHADDWERGPNEKQQKPCTSHTLETPYGALGYDHIVTIQNACDHTEHCEIKASSNASTLTLDVPKGETRSITVRRGSPAREFQAKVSCKPKS